MNIRGSLNFGTCTKVLLNTHDSGTCLAYSGPGNHVLCLSPDFLHSFWYWSCSVAKSCLTLWPHGLQHARPLCLSLSPKVCSDLCPLSQWCRPAFSSSATIFSCCLQSFPASGSFPMSQLFASGHQSIGVSASVLPMNVQGWFPLGLTCLISVQSKGLCSYRSWKLSLSFSHALFRFPYVWKRNNHTFCFILFS